MARPQARLSRGAKRPRHVSVATDGIRSVHRVAQDRWLHKKAPRGSRSAEKVYGELRAMRVPPRVISTLEGWGTSPEQVRPLARLIRGMIFAKVYYDAQQKRARWAAGTARDPHYKQSPEDPGALGPRWWVWFIPPVFALLGLLQQFHYYQALDVSLTAVVSRSGNKTESEL